jgi:hypothetical protein
MCGLWGAPFMPGIARLQSLQRDDEPPLLLDRLSQHRRTGAEVCAASVPGRNSVHSCSQRRSRKGCLPARQRHGTQSRAAILERDLARWNAAELRSHARREGHRLPGRRGIQRRGQGDGTAGFVHPLTQCRRRTARERRAPVVHRCNGLCAHTQS